MHSGQYQCIAVLKCFEEELLSGVFDVAGGGKRDVIYINFSSQFINPFVGARKRQISKYNLIISSISEHRYYTAIGRYQKVI